MNKYANTMKIIRGIREKTDTAVLYYSAGGKDGIALLDMLANVFPKVICYYMYVVPDLEHINTYIRYAEQKYGAEVRKIEHYQVDHIKRVGYFCEKDTTVKVRTVGEVEQSVREETGIKYAFSGMKGVDGYMKRMRLKMFAKTGYVTEKGMVYPLAVWTNQEVLAYIRSRNLIQPFEYDAKHVSQGFGLDVETLKCLKRKFPNDYQKVLEYYPECEKVMWDYENLGRLPNGYNMKLK